MHLHTYILSNNIYLFEKIINGVTRGATHPVVGQAIVCAFKTQIGVGQVMRQYQPDPDPTHDHRY